MQTQTHYVHRIAGIDMGEPRVVGSGDDAGKYGWVREIVTTDVDGDSYTLSLYGVSRVALLTPKEIAAELELAVERVDLAARFETLTQAQV